MRRPGVLVGAGLAALLLSLFGCTPGGQRPNPTPPPTSVTSTPAPTQEDLDYAAAEASYRAFRAEFERVLIAGGAAKPTAKMKKWAGGPYLREVTEVVQAYKGLGVRREGHEEIAWIEPGAYSPEELNLLVCEDTRAVFTVESDGERESLDEVRELTIEVKRSEGGWQVWDGQNRKVDSCD